MVPRRSCPSPSGGGFGPGSTRCSLAGGAGVTSAAATGTSSVSASSSTLSVASSFFLYSGSMSLPPYPIDLLDDLLRWQHAATVE